MQIENPLRLNDWSTKAFLKAVLSVQSAVFVLIGLSAVGIEIPVIRALVCFVYLTFIPGIVVLRILGLHGLNAIENYIYIVALSIAFLMFAGFLAAVILPSFGILNPISLLPLLAIVSTFVILGSLCSAKIETAFPTAMPVNVDRLASPVALFLLLIPFLAICGTYLVNYFQNSVVLMGMIIVISVVAALIGFDKLPKHLYPLAVAVIALALLYHNSLISQTLVNYSDIGSEFATANMVLTNASWNPTFSTLLNSVLSLVMLAPIYSLFTNVDLVWVIKIIFPFLYSVVPLCLFRIAQKQTNDKIAFLSSFLFISTYVFYTTMLGNNRGMIGELLLLSAVLVLLDRQMSTKKTSFLFIVFTISLAVSYYSLAYIYVYSLLFLWLALLAVDHRKAGGSVFPSFRIGNLLRAKQYPKSSRLRTPGGTQAYKRDSLTVLVILSFVLILAWSTYTAGSESFSGAVSSINDISHSIFTEFFQNSPGSGYSSLTQASTSQLGSIYKYIVLLTQAFIVIGIIGAVLKKTSCNLAIRYITLSLSWMLLLFLSIAVPAMSSVIGADRFYGYSLIVLAPFSVLGGMIVVDTMQHVVLKRFKQVRGSTIGTISIKVLSIFFIAYFLFSVGFVQQLAGEPISVTLSPAFATTSQRAVYGQGDLLAAEWLHMKKDPHFIIYSAGPYLSLGLFTSNVFGPLRGVSDLETKTTGTYIFLGEKDLKTHTLWLLDPHSDPYHSYVAHLVQFDAPQLNSTLSDSQKIYDSGKTQVLQGLS